MGQRIAIGLGIALSWPAAGQTVPEAVKAAPPPAPQEAATPGAANGRQRYDAAYFAPYSPSTALQIVQRVPGFAIEETDSSVRGFGGAAGNIVINGQRPSSKSDTLETILSRIPASRVLRVEVGPGDLYGADFAGKAQVLNLVLNGSGGMAGTAQVGARREFTGRVIPTGSASALIHSGKSTFNVSAQLVNGNRSEEGYDIVTAIPSGNLVEYRRKTNVQREPTGVLSGSWAYEDGANKSAHINGSATIDRYALDQYNHVIPTGAPVRDDRLIDRYHYDLYEIGGDVTRPFAGGGLKLVGLASQRQRLFRDLSLNIDATGIVGGYTQLLKDTLDERLARVTWTRARPGGWTIETGAEDVINRLDSSVDLFALNPGGAPMRIDLPIDHAVVKELRGEAFFNAGRPLGKKLRVDLGLTYETSHLTVTGDAAASRVLSFLKPKATIDWRPFGKWHAQLSLQRTVAQLQFEDFISSAELNNGRINGGNANLQPQRAWEALLTIDRPILGDGLYKLELGYNRVSMVQDRVPVPGGFDAPGNLGNGSVFILRNRIDMPLARLGIKGGRLTLYGSYVNTSVRDPYTLTLRPFSGNSAFYGEATFRQDLKHVAWGLTVSGYTPSTLYRLDELDRSIGSFPNLNAFIDWRPNALTTITLAADDLSDTPSFRRRTFFAPDRTNPAPYLKEFRYRNSHIRPSLTIKRSFG